MPLSIDDILSRLKVTRQVGQNKWEICCPSHQDNNASAYVELKPDGWVRLGCSTGCKEHDMREAIGLMHNSDLYLGERQQHQGNYESNRSPRPAAKKPTERGKLEAQYYYRDQDGEIIARKDRFAPPPSGGRKTFLWFRVNTFDGSFVSGMDKTERPLYQLQKVAPAVKSGKPVFLVEGEKCVEAIERLELVATTLPDGAGSHWADAQVDSLRGATVLILPDHDEAGEKYATEAVEKLTGVAKVVKVVRLPGIVDMPPKSDVVDWLAAGHTKAELIEAANGSEESEIDIPQYVKRINQEYAFIISGAGKPVILHEVKKHDGGFAIDFLSQADFDAIFAPERIEIVDGNKLKEVPVSKLWFKHKHRRQYDEIAFEPSGCPPNVYNLWRGFAVQPKQGDWSLMQQHILDNICSGNPSHYEYVLNWMARVCQDPGGKRPGVAIVLRGKEGTGKGKFVSNFGALFGSHFLQINNSTHLLGRFTEHLRSAVVVFLDEVFWGGNKASEGLLKGIITEEERINEDKGRPAYKISNHMNIIMASNNEWVVPAGPDARRFFVLDVGCQKMQQGAFFHALQSQMDNGGREAMLHDLLQRDLAGVDLRVFERTDALQDQFEQTIQLTIEGFWKEILYRGYIINEGDQWDRYNDTGPEVSVTDLYDLYIEWCKTMGVRNPRNTVHFGRKMKHLANPIKNRGTQLNGKRYWSYIFPPLQDCRERFDKVEGCRSCWDDFGDDDPVGEKRSSGGDGWIDGEVPF